MRQPETGAHMRTLGVRSMAQRNLAPYLLGHGHDELRRLQLQPAQSADEADWLLDQMEITAGNRAIGFGCGPRGVLDHLSARVGSSGLLIGFDQGREDVAPGAIVP
jgi:hypothetical protein